MLSIGSLLSRDQIGTVPNNTIVVNNAPQLELLKRAAVCITHGGFNTVPEALTQGVPQIAIPVTNDQPGVAVRIEYKKTGKTTSLDGLNPLHLSELLDEVLANPIYRDNSRAIQKAIGKTNGLSCAADLLEQAFGVAKTKVKQIGAAGRRENSNPDRASQNIAPQIQITAHVLCSLLWWPAPRNLWECASGGGLGLTVSLMGCSLEIGPDQFEQLLGGLSVKCARMLLRVDQMGVDVILNHLRHQSRYRHAIAPRTPAIRCMTCSQPASPSSARSIAST